MGFSHDQEASRTVSGVTQSHTLGPWISREREPEIRGFAVLPSNAPNGYCLAIVPENRRAHSEVTANACLVASAPEMLDALIAVKHGAEYPDELGNIIDAAIAKATGATS